MLVPPRLLGQLRRTRFMYGPPSVAGHGDRRSRQKGEGIEFEEYRLYEPGDDFRRVDSAAFLRTGKHYVKRYAVDRALDVTIVADFSDSMKTGSPEKLTMVLRLAACLAYIALAGGDRVRIGLLGATPIWHRLVQGLARFEGITEWLLDQERGRGRLHASVLERALLRDLGGAGLVVVLSDCLIDGMQDVLRRTRQTTLDVVVMQVLSPEELEPWALGTGPVNLTDAETGEVVETELNEESIERYARALAAWNDGIQSTLRTPDRYFMTRSDAPLDGVVVRRWRAQGLIT